MENNNVTLLVYGSAAAVAALLTLTYLSQWIRHGENAALTPAAALHAVSLGFTAAGAGVGFDKAWPLFFDALHYSAWILAIQLTGSGAVGLAIPFRLRLIWLIAWLLTLSVPLLTALGTPSEAYAHGLRLALAAGCLLTLEKVSRMTRPRERHIKRLFVGLHVLFLFDVFVYSHALASQQLMPELNQARALASLMVFAVLMRLALNESGFLGAKWLGMTVVFTTTAFSVALGLVDTDNTMEQRSVLFALAMVTVSAISVIPLNRLMSRITVQIRKRFLKHKYDYRSEWLRLTNYLAQPTPSSEAPQRAFFAIAAVTNTPGGAIWVRDQDRYCPIYQTGLGNVVCTDEEPIDSAFSRTLLHAEWVFFPDGEKDDSLGQYNECLPSWTQAIPDLWLLFPFIVGEELVGFAALVKPATQARLTWEDLDLLKAMGRQLASYLKRHQQAEQIAEGRQFDTYNKLVAFIIHDLNNLIAQQALVVRNAKKHKDKPAFVEDAIQTITHSVERMNQLLLKLRATNRDVQTQVYPAEVIKKAIADCEGQQPCPTAQIATCDHSLMADETRLTMALSNFIKNAQEATPDHGWVHVTLECHGDRVQIRVQDNGSGMDPGFIQNRLFKPFETTKSGKGMGIGVYLSREYIKDLRGKLIITSAPGKATCVTVELPVTFNQGELTASCEKQNIKNVY